jgi:hypothetical protein
LLPLYPEPLIVELPFAYFDGFSRSFSWGGIDWKRFPDRLVLN